MIADGHHRLWTPLLSAYVHRKLKRAFRGLWVHGALPEGGEPIVLYANHSSFWDGFVAHALTVRAGRMGHAVMEEHNLLRYRFLSRLGAVSVRRGDARSALETLRHCRALLRRPGTAVLLFAQGQLLPARAPLHFERGLEVLARMSGARCVPIALRYGMFEHEYPDVLINVGAPHAVEPVTVSEARLHGLLQQLDHVEAPTELTPLLAGRRSVAERWDLARRLNPPLPGDTP